LTRPRPKPPETETAKMSKPQRLNNRTHLREHFVYFNLHKRCWSLKALQSYDPTESSLFHTSVKGRVTGHADTILLSDTTTKISEAGRQRVIREKRKNVHAGITCVRCIVEPDKQFVTTDKTRTMSYNPYKRADFYDRESGRTVTTAPYVLMRSGCNDGPPRVYYGDELYYAYWTDEEGGIDHEHTTGFISKAELYYWIGITHFTGFVRRVSRPYHTYLNVIDGCVSFAD